MLIKIGNITILLMIILSFTFSTKCSTIRRNVPSINDRPIIGILMQEISTHSSKMYSKGYSNYIAASYVKFIEGAGGRVVPIWTGQSTKYYENILKKINGVLLPGGSALFNKNGGYASAGYQIYRIAKEMNKEGDYFPILGICLGFELLPYVAANNRNIRVKCSSQSQALPLNFEHQWNQSKLFKNAPSDIINILNSSSVTINFHNYCVTERRLEKAGLSDDFQVISTNKDKYGLRFVSSMEHTKFPFYGLQFHPEKNLYEWIEGKNIPHTANAARVTQYFANFFVNEGRKSTHHFENKTEELYSLIYNYPTVYTGVKGSAFVQCYVF